MKCLQHGGLRRSLTRTSVLFFCLVFLLSACAVSADAEPMEPESPMPEPVATIDEPVSKEVQAILDRVAIARDKLEALRGLKFSAEVKQEVVTADQMRQYIVDALDKHNDPSVFQREGDEFKALGLIPEAMDYKAMMTGQMGAITSGAYDQWEKTLRLILGRDPASQEATIAHELFHGLQHQQWPDLIDGGSSTGRDGANANRALIEADAMLMQEAYVLDQAGIGLDKYRVLLGQKLLRKRAYMVAQMERGGAPRYFIDKNTFEYADAVNFVHALYNAGGWKMVNEKMSDPPTSTEQILHPERYLVRRDYPTEIVLSALDDYLTKEYGDKAISNTAGELLIRSVLRTHLGNDHDNVAAGWDGDTYYVWTEPKTKRRAMVWVSLWDSADDAAEFAAASKTMLAGGFGRTLQSGDDADFANGYSTVRWEKGSRVVVWVDNLSEADKVVLTLSNTHTISFNPNDAKKGSDDAKPLKPIIPATKERAALLPLYGNGSRHYENYRYQWTLDLPDGAGFWQMTDPTRTEEEQHQWIWFMHMNPKLQVQLRSRFVEMDLTVEQRFNLLESARAISMTDYKRLAYEPITVNGMNGFYYAYMGTHQPPLPKVTLQHDLYVFFDKDREIMIEIPAVPNWAARHKDVIGGVVRGLKVLHPNTAWPEPNVNPDRQYSNEEFNFRLNIAPEWTMVKPDVFVSGAKLELLPAKESPLGIIRIVAQKVPLGFNLAAHVDGAIAKIAKDESNVMDAKANIKLLDHDALGWGYRQADGKSYRKVYELVANHIHYRMEWTCEGEENVAPARAQVADLLTTWEFIR